MRIAHIVCAYPPYYGGMGNVVFQTAAELTKLGHEVEVLTPQYYESKEMKPAEAGAEKEHAENLNKQIDYARRLTPALQYGNAAYLPQIANELDAFDIVHLHYPFFGTANLVRRWKKRHPRRPLLITYHMDTRGPGWKGLFFKYYSRYWLPKILSAADKLLVSSFDYLESSQAADFYQENPGKWLELPYGVDSERFQSRAKPLPLLEQLRLDPKTPVLLFVGGMDEAHYFKGIPIFLNALKQLKNNGLTTQAILVGDGGLRPDFELQARFLGIGETIRFVGEVDDESLPYFYNLADLLVLPSVNQAEAFGLVLLEAMASGVPVVASDLPGVRAVARDGGTIVEPNNAAALAEAVYDYFADADKMSGLKTAARQTAEQKYAWGPIVKRLDGVYQELVEKPRR